MTGAGASSRPRLRQAIRVSASALALAFALMLVLASIARPARAASCSGELQGTAFSFSCDAQIGGNSQGLLFQFSARALASASVISPAGVSCESRSGRVLCKGPAVPAGTTVSGSFTFGSAGEEEGGEEGEACAGVLALVYGSETVTEGEETYAQAIGRFGLSPCGSSEEGGRGTPASAFSLGKPKLNRKMGTALLPVTVPAPGSLVLSGKDVVKATALAKRAGTVSLTVKVKGSSKRTLLHTGKVTVKVQVTFTPSRGRAVARAKKITLRHA